MLNDRKPLQKFVVVNYLPGQENCPNVTVFTDENYSKAILALRAYKNRGYQAAMWHIDSDGVLAIKMDI